MRLLVVILAVFFIGAQAARSSDQDSIDIDVTTIKPFMKKGDSKVPHNAGDDDDETDDGSAVQGDGSGGSASGETTTAVPTKVTELEPTKKAPGTLPPEKSTKFSTEGRKSTMEPKATEMSTEKLIEVVKKNEETIEPTTEEEIFAGGVSNTGEPDVQARKQGQDETSVLTTEVIAAVVVGGVCAIILIAFLVYRLRKRDEGSYVLTDSAYKDTNKLRGDTGKEAFV